MARSVRMATALGAGEVCVVLGYRAAVMRNALRRAPGTVGGVRTVRSPRWRDGMGRSLAFGVRVLPRQARAVLVLLCDQPLVETADLHRLVAAWRSKPHWAAASSYAGRLGAPAVFPRSWFPRLAALSGDEGARDLLQSRQDITAVAMPHAAHDLDTPADMGRLLTYSPISAATQ